MPMHVFSACFFSAGVSNAFCVMPPFAHSPIAGHLDGYWLGTAKKTSREQS